jgi:hypothetical protein
MCLRKPSVNYYIFQKYFYYFTKNHIPTLLFCIPSMTNSALKTILLQTQLCFLHLWGFYPWACADFFPGGGKKFPGGGGARNYFLPKKQPKSCYFSQKKSPFGLPCGHPCFYPVSQGLWVRAFFKPGCYYSYRSQELI